MHRVSIRQISWGDHNSLIQIEAQRDIQNHSGFGVSDSAAPGAFDGGAVESGVAAWFDDDDLGGPAPGIDGDAKDDCSFFAGLAGFGGINESGSFRKGGLGGRDIG